MDRAKKREPQTTRDVGDFGEIAAVKFLFNEGYRILERNYRCDAGEVDIIAEHRGTICFVEVKTRSENYVRAPEEAVDHEKQRRLRATARHYLSRFRDPSQVRFDVVSVVLSASEQIGRIELRKDVFPWEP